MFTAFKFYARHIVEIIQASTYHFGDQLDTRKQRRLKGSNQISISQDSDPVRDVVDLVNEMRNKDNAHPILA